MIARLRPAFRFLDGVWRLTRNGLRFFGAALVCYVFTVVFAWFYAAELFVFVAVWFPTWFALGCQTWHYLLRARFREAIRGYMVDCRLCDWSTRVPDPAMMGPVATHHFEYDCPGSACPECGRRGFHAVYGPEQTGEPVIVQCADTACASRWPLRRTS